MHFFFDNGSNFHTSLMIQCLCWLRHKFEFESICITYFEPGEGKTALDYGFGVLKQKLCDSLRCGSKTSDLESYLDALKGVKNVQLFEFQGGIPETVFYFKLKNIKSCLFFQMDCNGLIGRPLYLSNRSISFEGTTLDRFGNPLSFSPPTTSSLIGDEESSSLVSSVDSAANPSPPPTPCSTSPSLSSSLYPPLPLPLHAPIPLNFLIGKQF